MLMCRDLAEIASDYIDGELKLAARLSVRMHLMMCRHCRTFVEGLRTSVLIIQIHSTAQVDPRFVDRIDGEIMRALEQEPGNK